MANLNTSKTIGIASTALAPELEDTRKNLKLKCKKIGIDTTKLEKIRLPRIAGSGDDVITVWINGQAFYFKRGEAYDLPAEIIAVLENAEEV